MEDMICYFNGKYIRESEVRISLNDLAFWEGFVYDIARTYNHVPFFWKEHDDRLSRSLHYTRIDPGLTSEEMHNIALEVFERNKNCFEPEDDIIVVFRISRGAKAVHYSPLPPATPTVLINLLHLSPAYESMAKIYQEGIHLVVANTRQIPPQCLDVKAKILNRMTNTLATLEAKMVDPEAYCLMLDINGRVAEGSIYNCFMVQDDKLLTPKRDNVLAGITRGTILRLARELGIETVEMDLWTYDFYNADEIFTTATTFTIGPVAKFNEKILPGPIPGPVTQQLLSAFSKLVGVDIVQRVVNYVKTTSS